jgi:membrane-associated phospholipid phosphatase
VTRTVPPDDRLLPAHLHGGLAATALLALGVLVPLAALVAGVEGSTRLDQAVFLFPWPDQALLDEPLEWLLAASATGLPLLMPPVAVALAVLCWRAASRRAAVLCLVAPAAASLATAVLKPLLGRPAQSGEGFMFPSGHVTAVAAVATVLAVLLLPGGVLASRSYAFRVWAWTALLTVTAAAALGTALLGYHYLTDVVGALLVAVAVVLGVAATIDRLAA